MYVPPQKTVASSSGWWRLVAQLNFSSRLAHLPLSGPSDLQAETQVKIDIKWNDSWQKRRRKVLLDGNVQVLTLIQWGRYQHKKAWAGFWGNPLPGGCSSTRFQLRFLLARPCFSLSTLEGPPWAYTPEYKLLSSWKKQSRIPASQDACAMVRRSVAFLIWQCLMYLLWKVFMQKQC